MRIGVVFPQTESGTDIGAIREYLRAVEELGYVHLVVYDHVLGADTRTRPDWKGPYHAGSLFHEPMVFFGFVAAITRLELAPSVIVLPQRQTALAAKQAAEIDVLTGGRSRFGVGLGWNAVEYEALGMRFQDRNRRIEEQIALMRRLWTDPVVDFTGRWHRVDRAGLNPLPVQRPIPVWMGGRVDDALKRIARVADGWFASLPLHNDAGRAAVERFHGYLREAGRDPSTFPIEGAVRVSDLSDGPDAWVRTAHALQDLGCTHLEVDTMRAGYTDLAAHIATLERFRRDAGALFATT